MKNTHSLLKVSQVHIVPRRIGYFEHHAVSANLSHRERPSCHLEPVVIYRILRTPVEKQPQVDSPQHHNFLLKQWL